MIVEITKLLEELSNSIPSYSHPNNAARLYQVFQDLGYSVGQRMSQLQQEERNDKLYKNTGRSEKKCV